MDIEVSGHSIRLSYDQFGTAGSPGVLVLHGWGSSAEVMRPIGRWLEPDFNVVVLDLPGHGHSPPPPVAWGVPEHAQLVRHVTERLFDGPFSIVGHSNGGRIALYLSSENNPPAWLQRLILISPSGVRRRRDARYYIRKTAAATLKAPFQVLPAPARDVGLDWLRHTLVWRLLGSSDYRNVSGVMRETFVKTVNCYLEDRLDRILVPTLLFRGDRDDAITAEQMERMEERILDAGVVTVEGAGHYPFIDRPDIVRAAMLYFLAES